MNRGSAAYQSGGYGRRTPKPVSQIASDCACICGWIRRGRCANR